jgi:hypothetical protein
VSLMRRLTGVNVVICIRTLAVSEDHLRLRNQMRTFTELLQRCMRVEIPFLEEIKDLTLGTEIEEWLNRPYGPGSVTRNFTST